MKGGLVNASFPVMETNYEMVFLESFRQNLLIFMANTFLYMLQILDCSPPVKRLTMCFFDGSAEGLGAHTKWYKRIMRCGGMVKMWIHRPHPD